MGRGILREDRCKEYRIRDLDIMLDMEVRTCYCDIRIAGSEVLIL